jgi:hypothetical protein
MFNRINTFTFRPVTYRARFSIVERSQVNEERSVFVFSMRSRSMSGDRFIRDLEITALQAAKGGGPFCGKLQEVLNFSVSSMFLFEHARRATVRVAMGAGRGEALPALRSSGIHVMASSE